MGLIKLALYYYIWWCGFIGVLFGFIIPIIIIVRYYKNIRRNLKNGRRKQRNI